MKEQITITISIDQYNAIKSALLNNQAKAFMDEDKTAYEMYQSAYQAIIAADAKTGGDQNDHIAKTEVAKGNEESG